MQLPCSFAAYFNKLALIDDVDITKLTETELLNVYKKFGYMFQFAALLDSLNVLENVGITLFEQGKIRFFGDAQTVWDSDNPYIYQFIRGLSEGPIQTEIAHVSEQE